MTRREFITLLGGAAVAWPVVARAQQGMRRVGVLMSYPQQVAAKASRARGQQPGMPVVGFLRDSTAAGSEFMVNGLRKGLARACGLERRTASSRLGSSIERLRSRPSAATTAAAASGRTSGRKPHTLCARSLDGNHVPEELQ
jgi:putative ABC transport system substrate-binding protein